MRSGTFARMVYLLFAGVFVGSLLLASRIAHEKLVSLPSGQRSLDLADVGQRCTPGSENVRTDDNDRILFVNCFGLF